MATNRFVQSGTSQYLSQYVPHKLPFELWQQNLANTDAKIDTAKQQLGAYDPQVLGLKELGIPQSERDYYGGTTAAITQRFGNLAAKDYELSQQTANTFNTELTKVADDDFIMKAATGDVADEFMKLNQLYKQHENQNAVFQQRLDWKKEADKQIVSKGEEVTASPYLLSGYKSELAKMEADPFYVPTGSPVIGKSLDRYKELNSQISIEDSGGKSINYDNPLYVTWSSSRGVSGDKYAAYAFDILSSNNSAIRRDIEAQVDLQIQAGDLDPEQRDTAINHEIMNLVDTARNKEHKVSDKGERYKSGEERTAIEDSKIIQGTGEINEFSPPQSLNQVNQTVTALSAQWNTVTEELRGLKYGSPEWNKKDIERKNVENQLYQYKAGAILGEMEIRNNYDPGGKNNIELQKREVNVYLNNNPQILEQVIVKNPDGSYQLDYNKLATLSKGSGLSQETLIDAATIIGEEIANGQVEEKINMYQENNIALNVYKNYDNRATTEDKKNLLSSLGVDINGMSNGDIIDAYDSYRVKGQKVETENNTVISQRETYNNDLEAQRNAPVDVSKYDYYTTTTGVRSITNQELGFINADLDVTNSKIVLADGTVISDPELIKSITNSIYTKGDNVTGAVAGNGRVKVSTTISKWDLMTAQDRELEIAKLDIDVNDKTAYTAWQTGLKNSVVTVDAYLQGGANTSKTISNNTVNQVLNDPNKSNEEKTSFVTGLMNEQTFKDLNGETSKLIVSYSEGKEVTGAGTTQTTNEEEFFVQPNKTINVQMVNGTSYETVPVNVIRVEMNNDYGTPQLVYTFNINGQELTSTPLPTEDSQAFTDYVTALIYSTQN